MRITQRNITEVTKIDKNNKFKTSTPNKDDSVGSLGNCSSSSIDATPTKEETDKKHNKRDNLNKGGFVAVRSNNRDKKKEINFMTFFYIQLLCNFHEYLLNKIKKIENDFE